MARLVFRNGPYSGKSLQLPPGKSVMLGRSREIELPLPDLKLSRKHCQIVPQAEGYMLKDMGSTNGTYLNGQRVQGEQALHHFDRLLLGDTEIEFQFPESLEKMKSGSPKAIEDADTNPGAPDPEKLESAAQQHANGGEIPLGGPPVFIDEPSAPVAASVTDQHKPVAANPSGVIIEGEIELEEEPEPMSPEDAAALIRPAAAKAPASRGILMPDDAEPAMASGDPYTVAVLELDRALPPEPSGPAHNPQLLFCDQCDVSVPELDYELGLAKEVEERLLCRECQIRGSAPIPQATIPTPAAIALPTPQPLTPPQPPLPRVSTTRKTELDVDAMLKGLDDAPELVIENVPKWKQQKQGPGPAAAPSKEEGAG